MLDISGDSVPSKGAMPVKSMKPIMPRPWQESLAGLVALLSCWLLFFREISGEWKVNAQYSYGYVVPLLGAVLFCRRWPDRPPAEPANPAWLPWLVAGLVFLELPFILVFEANPEWRMLYWANGLQMLALTCALLFFLGGRRWVRHFAPPLAFMLIAVPWPMVQEQWAIQGLMRFVASLTVVVVGILGIPGIQHGNLIEVGTGIVGIDEACSGVRSLQSALMLSLFLGEMHRMSHARRLALLASSLVLVLVANVTRTSILVWTAANHGLKAMESVHDTVGLVVMFIVLPCLIGLAYLIKPRFGPPVPPETNSPILLRKIPAVAGLATLAWLVLCMGLTEAWYRSHESHLVPNTPWTLKWPDQDAGFHKGEISQTSLAILRCTDSRAASWLDDNGNDWSAFLLKWAPGRNSEQLAKGHRPDICFPAAGSQLVKDYGLVQLQPNGVKMVFHNQMFSNSAGYMYVFYCLWSDRVSPHEENNMDKEVESQAGRIRAVLDGKRNLGQQVLEIVIRGPDTDDAALKLLKAQLPDLVRHG